MELVLKNICKNFGKKNVLRNINFKFEEGKIYGLLGRNGAGKTTFFNCLNDDIELNSGEFYLECNGNQQKIMSEDIGYVLSIPTVPKFLTGREFLKFFIDINKDKINNLRTVDEYFDLIKIDTGDRDKLLIDYSLGMQNKMQMIVNIMFNSKVLLLDEPLTSLDVVASEDMKEILKKIKRNHIIILSTHIMDLALDLCDEIVLLNNGTLEKIDRNDLNNTAFKDAIINALKEEK